MEFRQSRIGYLNQVVRIAEDANVFLRAGGCVWQTSPLSCASIKTSGRGYCPAAFFLI